jgi:hypothetical protein
MQIKRRIWARFGLLIAVSICTGCANTAASLSESIASWQGSHIDDVESAWGAPNDCKIEDGQRVCTWTDEVPAEADAPPITENTLLPRPSCVRMLAVDASGYVTGWRWRGTRCAGAVSVARAQ